ncbi:hypothetical protein P175DRAFT_0528149 [Aspergillus ochraceoroseus IBT 24754]|uniref:Uncharacterized protein n=1 Tax=Aspergillus ochraceoroseus IBT 24754 TaxID=1392256 RepID=A0A2T5M7Y6_9EURO|nr:uncharacterized protein P175DRAFT_0528149 [Aspergillus ochraceoroseus IBT 24754]PTU24651.1 hypothetical protein P175DRAFT_0528149 [Aspergillus ochraceoroseus IBT 24754]
MSYHYLSETLFLAIAMLGDRDTCLTASCRKPNNGRQCWPDIASLNNAPHPVWGGKTRKCNSRRKNALTKLTRIESPFEPFQLLHNRAALHIPKANLGCTLSLPYSGEYKSISSIDKAGFLPDLPSKIVGI